MLRVASLRSSITATRITSAPLLLGASRSIYSIWGTVPHEGNLGYAPNDQTPTIHKALDATGTRFHRLMTVPAVNPAELPAHIKLSEPEEYLLSAIEDDIKRINAVDWTIEFDSFWGDRVYSHEKLFEILYAGPCNSAVGWAKFIFSDCSANEEAKLYIGARLAFLQSTLKWAKEAEQYYSAIVRARFDMQRTVFDALEREKILAGCAVLVEEFKAKVPAEFARKATTDLEFHLNNLRHWVWDAPNAKMHFPRQLL